MTNTFGTVSLVGAGPGDPGLITAKGLRRLREADVVLYDRLVDERLLKEVKLGTELIYVGKNPGGSAKQQQNVFPLLIDKSREGKRVVRLKGGDPFIFGRGGEEAQVLAMAGIPFEIVPGVTSAIASPAYAGIPLTHRTVASSFTVVSGIENPEKNNSTIPWDILARTKGTLVILMGWGSMPTIIDKLIKAGLSRSTPAALVQWGTEPYQKTKTGILSDIVLKGEKAGLGPPVILIIGPIVKLRNEIRWFDSNPLFGKRVLVTRPSTQSSLSQLLSDEGALPLEIPVIEITPPNDYSYLDYTINNLAQYVWIIFTSVNGVSSFFQRLNVLKLDSRAFATTKVCAIGPITASALKNHGINADFIPDTFNHKYLVNGLKKFAIRGAKILYPRTDIAPNAIFKELTALGALVDEPTIYQTVLPAARSEEVQEVLRNGKIDIVTFTSSSTVNNMIALLDGKMDLLEEPLIASIGPITSQTARDLKLRVDITAPEHTLKGLVQAIKTYLK